MKRKLSEIQALYDDPAVVNAMDVLRAHGITGEQYNQLVNPPLVVRPEDIADVPTFRIDPQ
jgi:hypothetical protein